jgi:mxaA protein
VAVGCVLALLAPAALAADAAVPQPVVSLRDSGYLLGDLVDEHVLLPLAAGFELDRDSLPLPGRVAPWLELRQVRSEASADAGVLELVATFQVFAETEQAARVPIPAWKLRLRDGAQTRTVTVAERSFLLSPALPPTLTDEDRELKPSLPPQALPRTGAIAGLVLAFAAACGCAGYLLWAHDRLPFLPRSPGPFARLWRRWRRRQRRGLSAADNEMLLRDWHAALNQAAGETLYASTLARLFVRAPHLQPLREPIEQAFAASWSFFYERRGTPAAHPGHVLDLARQAAERERGVPC